MNKKSLLMAIVGLVVFSFILLPFAVADDNITFNSIKSHAGGVTGSDYLTAYSISGIRNTLYFAFDFSNFPSGATPNFAAFYAKSYVILDACNVEAFYFSSADWSNLNDTVLTPTGVYNFVSQGDELYAFTSKSFIDAVTQACLEGDQFTVCLKARANVYGDSTVVFYPDATLEVTYTTTSLTSSPTPTFASQLPTEATTPYQEHYQTTNPTSTPTSQEIPVAVYFIIIILVALSLVFLFYIYKLKKIIENKAY
jgi:hypothetical protein